LALLITLFTKKKTEEELKLIKFIIQKFGYRPKELTYFIKAITHKSFVSSDPTITNERLEFLGDAMLDAVVADFLFKRFKD